MEQPSPTNKPNEKEASKKDISAGKGMAILSYFGILALIPYFSEKNNKFVRYHAIQGMNIFLVLVAYAIIVSVVSGIVWSATVGNCVSSVYYGSAVGCTGGFGAASIVSLIFGLGYLALGIICILGIVYAAQGQTKEVPLLGKIKIIKK